MLIKITKKHIKEGRPEFKNTCPIACAIKELIPTAEKESVEVDHISISYNDKITRKKMNACLPVSAQKFIDDFDYGRKVKPFSFKVKFK